MPGPTIDQAFIIKFNKDAHLTFQQKASKLRGTVRTDGEVSAESCRFQKIGAVSMGTKSRNGEIPVTSPAHSYAVAPMNDRYLRVLIDKLDLTKLNIDVRNGYIETMSNAAGRQIDDFIIDAMEAGASQTIGDYGSSDTDYIDRNMALEINEALDRQDVPRDGLRFAAVTPRQWAALECINQFVSADYNGPDLPFKKMGFETRTWNDVHWMVHNRLPGVGTSQTKCYAWHMRAIGHGIANEIEMQWVWNNGVYAWDGACALSMGAVVIDAGGLVEIRVDDTGGLPT